MSHKDRKHTHNRERIYFAHPILISGWLADFLIVKELELRGYEVVDPSDETHQNACVAYRLEHKRGRANTFWRKLAERCDCCAFTSFPFDIGADVVPSTTARVAAPVVEIVNDFLSRGKEVWYVSPDFAHLKIGLIPFLRWEGFHPLTPQETDALLRAQELQILAERRSLCS